MRKKILLVLTICILAVFTTFVYAADDEYSFGIEYEGTVVVGEAKATNVTLVGNNGTLHSNVRIKVDISGPGTPKLIAYDDTQTAHDIAQIGYWGPPGGFPVQGTFTNKTPVTATFDKAGKYTITLSLIDLGNSNSVITSKAIDITVEEKAAVDNTAQNTVNNVIQNTVNTTNNVVNNEINEIPQTGTSMFEYVLCFVVTALVIVFGYIIIRNGKEK